MWQATFVALCDECGAELNPQPRTITNYDKRLAATVHVCQNCRQYPVCGNDDCLNIMRPRNSSAKDHPGTVAKGSFGYCNVCYNAIRLYGKLPQKRRTKC